MTSELSTVELFISHSDRDKVLVRPLAGWLQQGLRLQDHQVRCTVVSNAAVGSIPADILRKDLKSAKVVVGLLTANSLRSNWAQLEMGAGWLQEHLHPIRGPGISVDDLPSPLSDFTTVGFCEKPKMLELLAQMAKLLSTDVDDDAERKLDEMARNAEAALVADLVRWFSLPPVLSAWRVARVNYEFALATLCDELGLDKRDLRSCATSEGILTRDPDHLPIWAKDLWSVSKNAVNFMLAQSNEVSEDSLDVPPGVLTNRLIADMHRALSSGRRSRPRLIKKWFADACEWISENPPAERRSHGGSGQH